MNFIYKTLPKHTEEDVSLDKVIEIFFMVDINKQTIKEENVILFNITEQKVEPVEFDYTVRLLKVKPQSSLKPLNHYQLQLVGGSEGIKDIIGRMMPETYELEFKTADVKEIKPPRLVSPVHQTVASSTVEIELLPVEEADYYEVQVSKSNTFHNLEWPTDGSKVYQTSEIKLTPNIAYETGNYYIRARSSKADGKKSAWSPVVQFYYNNEETFEEQQVSDDNENPHVDPLQKVILETRTSIQEGDQLSILQDAFSDPQEDSNEELLVKKTTPKDKSVNNLLSRVGQIVIEFSEDIDEDSVDEDSCYLLVERN